jgi:hypothetical protein
MSYIRTIPRDLFNEAKLLKCLGQVYLNAERCYPTIVFIWHDTDECGHFQIEQNPTDGSIYVENVQVSVNGKVVRVFCPLNSRLSYPLMFENEDETDYVFNDTGQEFSEAFKGIE